MPFTADHGHMEAVLSKPLYDALQLQQSNSETRSSSSTNKQHLMLWLSCQANQRGTAISNHKTDSTILGRSLSFTTKCIVQCNNHPNDDMLQSNRMYDSTFPSDSDNNNSTPASLWIHPILYDALRQLAKIQHCSSCHHRRHNLWQQPPAQHDIQCGLPDDAEGEARGKGKESIQVSIQPLLRPCRVSSRMWNEYLLDDDDGIDGSADDYDDCSTDDDSIHPGSTSSLPSSSSVSSLPYWSAMFIETADVPVLPVGSKIYLHIVHAEWILDQDNFSEQPYQNVTVGSSFGFDAASNASSSSSSSWDVLLESTSSEHSRFRLLLAQALSGRVIEEGVWLFLPIHMPESGCDGNALVGNHDVVMAVVAHVQAINNSQGVVHGNNDGNPQLTRATTAATAFCVGSMASFAIEISVHATPDDVESTQQRGAFGDHGVTHFPTAGASRRPVDSWEWSCPGMQKNCDALLHLIQVSALDSTKDRESDLTLNASNSISKTAAPTGILLTGCPGVGKSHMAQAVAQRLAQQLWHVEWILIPDLLLQASYATEESLFQSMLPARQRLALGPPPPRPPASHAVLVVLEDLHVLGRSNDESDERMLDREQLLVTNALTRVMDFFVASSSSRTAHEQVAVVGIAHSSQQLPSELVKWGRFEKELEIQPPTQYQRECILRSMLLQTMRTVGVNAILQEHEIRQINIWSERLACMTAGCVPADLQGICTSALARHQARCGRPNDLYNNTIHRREQQQDDDVNQVLEWADFFEAARSCIPSQLASLDVTKPPMTFKNELGIAMSWSSLHEASWASLAGFDQVKKRVYRTIVVPWRRLLLKESKGATERNEAYDISPPSGVLFHGKPGSGKTLAATCLASSLGMPMIKVKVADVMDKWLGGSEAAIRSLFQRARGASPVILFFDEMDAIASNREDGESVDVMSRMLSTLLNEMDGISTSSPGSGSRRVLVVACTNRLEALDAALLRPGRLEEHIALNVPTLEDALAIVKLHWTSVPLRDDVNKRALAQNLVDKGAGPAVIEGLCRESVLRAIRRHTVNEAESYVAVGNEDVQSAMFALKLC